MEAARERERERGGPALPAQSYWLDLWLFVLFDLALLVVVSLLP